MQSTFGQALTAVSLLGAASVAHADGITSARYVEPTGIYGHGAVEGGEYAALEVTMSSGDTQSVRYERAVFEDTAPRLHDFDGDGVPEVVTVVSSFSQGARVQIFGLKDGDLVPLASNAPIGQRNRWLAIAGIADLNGDGTDEIAFVDRPHLAKKLTVLSVDLESTQGIAVLTPLPQFAELGSLTNHHYGSPIIEGGIRTCEGQLPVIVTANANWTQIIETQMVDVQGGLEPVSAAVGTYRTASSFDPFLMCSNS